VPAVHASLLQKAEGGWNGQGSYSKDDISDYE
jgi:hypothetical protein